jgi:heme exporter protein C
LKRLDWLIACITLVLLGTGLMWGLVWAPAETFMGDVYRIIYVHVPCAWISLLAYTLSFGACLVYLFRESLRADAFAEASAEVGVLFNALLLITGSIWGKPTWGVWWTWDPRLTTAAVMFFLYAGYISLRKVVTDPDKRATWAAVVGIIIFVDIPIVWFSVKWWNSLHQLQSSPKTMSPDMVLALRINAFAFLGLMILFIRQIYQSARYRQRQLTDVPPALKPAIDGAK